MTTFSVKFEVKPTRHNAQRALVKGVFANCWVVEDSEPAAFGKAQFYVSKDEWRITRTATLPVPVAAEDFGDGNAALAQYEKAQEKGIAILYAGWARDGKTAAGPMPLQRSSRFDLNAYVRKQKSLARNGRCLHFKSGHRCGDIVNAHSIQKNGQLVAIAEDGPVYAVSRNIGTLNANDGRLTLGRGAPLW